MKTQKKQFFFNGGGFPGQNANNKKFYEILEVNQSASGEEIKKAFRAKAMKHHPDRGGDPEKFKEITTAYEVLSNEEKRKMYDQFGEDAVKGNGEGPGAGFDFSDIFGGGAHHKMEKKSKTILHVMKITLEEVFNGISKTIELKRKKICKSCKGSGANKPNAKTTCTSCKGKGTRVVTQNSGMGVMQQQVPCDVCEGTGKTIRREDRCRECNGDGSAVYNTKFEIDVPKGVNDGKRLVYRYEGDEIPGAKAGDLAVEIQIQKHPKFERKGADLYYKLNISLLEALTGFETVVNHFNGKSFVIKSKPGEIINPNAKKTVKGLGMPFLENSHQSGNLFIQFNIDFPKVLDQTQKEELLKVFKHQPKNPANEKIGNVLHLSDFRSEDENTSERGGRRPPEKEKEDRDNQGGFGPDGQQINCPQQ